MNEVKQTLKIVKCYVKMTIELSQENNKELKHGRK